MGGSNVLVTGYTGLLGNSLCRHLVNCGYSVYGVARNPVGISGVTSIKLDLSDKGKTSGVINEVKPLIVFHTAGLTNVDYCEEHPVEAEEVNVNTTANIAKTAKVNGCLMVYISTDFIFDGQRGGYSEEDLPNPINTYGWTKYEGERVTLDSGVSLIIARTSIYGWNLLPKQSLAEALINKLKNGQEFTPFSDNYFTPIYTGTLSDLLIKLIKADQRGIYNIVIDQKVSKYEFSKNIAEEFDLDTNLLLPKNASEVTFKAPRPVDVSLSNVKLKKALTIDNIDLSDDIALMKKEACLYAKSL